MMPRRSICAGMRKNMRDELKKKLNMDKYSKLLKNCEKWMEKPMILPLTNL